MAAAPTRTTVRAAGSRGTTRSSRCLPDGSAANAKAPTARSVSSRRIIDAPPAATWPFRYPLCPDLPDGPVLVRAFDVDAAYVNTQTGSTQLVTTQKKYLDAEWAAALARHGNAVLVIADDTEKGGEHGAITHPLPRAFRAADPAERLSLCVEALKSG